MQRDDKDWKINDEDKEKTNYTETFTTPESQTTPSLQILSASGNRQKMVIIKF